MSNSIMFVMINSTVYAKQRTNVPQGDSKGKMPYIDSVPTKVLFLTALYNR